MAMPAQLPGSAGVGGSGFSSAKAGAADDERKRKAEQRALVVQLPARAVSKWTPDDIEFALNAADNGDLQRVSDLCETLMADPEVQGILSTRTLGMLRLPIDFQGGLPIAQQALGGLPDTGLIGDWFRMHPESELSQLLAWGIVLGVGVAHRRPVPRDLGQRQLHKLDAWHPRWLRQDVITRQFFIQHMGGEDAVTIGDGQWIVYTPYGVTRPWARGAWRALAFAWVLKQFAIHDRARFSEVYGQPIRVGIAPEGATERGRTRWLSALKNLGRDAATVLPPGYDLKLLSVEAGKGGVEVFQQQIDWADRAIQVVLAGQVVTTEGTKGFSNGDIHERIKSDLIGFTADSASSCLLEQSLRPYAAINWGSPQAAPYPKWDTVRPEDQTEKAEALTAFGEGVQKADAALAPSGVRVDAKALAEEFSLPVLPLPQSTKAPTIQLAPTDFKIVVKVNEARASGGLPPLPEPEGSMPMALYEALQQSKLQQMLTPPQLLPGAPPASGSGLPPVTTGARPGAPNPPGAPPVKTPDQPGSAAPPNSESKAPPFKRPEPEAP